MLMLSYIIAVFGNAVGNFGSTGIEYAMYNVAELFYNLGS